MSAFEYGMADFHSIAADAAVLASGGGGSYRDALAILQQLADSGWRGTGRGISNARDDLAAYFDATTGKSTGNTVSIIQVTAASQLYQSPGVVASFAGLLRNMGYAGALPSA